MDVGGAEAPGLPAKSVGRPELQNLLPSLYRDKKKKPSKRLLIDGIESDGLQQAIRRRLCRAA